MKRASELLGAEGPLADQIPGFAPRQIQQTLAAAVEAVISDGGTLVAEAGTGTGKTFAYLIPALISGKRVCVSTGTRNLQDQLFHRDLPKVLQSLELETDVALLKGRSNYLCLYRLDQALNDGRHRDPRRHEELAIIREWHARTLSGDVAEISDIGEDSPVWPKVTSTTENCLGSNCPFIDECFVLHARRRAQDAGLIVVNHHLLFADMALRSEGFGEVLPGADVFVLDEAHQVPRTASAFFSRTVSARQMRDLARDALREAGEVTGASSGLPSLTRSLELAVQSLRLAIDQGPARGATRPRMVDGLEQEVVQLREAIKTLADSLEPLADASRGLEHVHRRSKDLGELLGAVTGAEEEGWVYWYEVRGQGFAFHATPLDIASPMQAFCAGMGETWVFTSATLAVGDSFAHFLAEMGLPDAETLRLDSPFDYRHHGLLYLPEGLPAPGGDRHTDAVVAAAWPVIEATEGRAFMLFTSHRALRRAAELLRADAPWPLFVQGEAPRAQLLADFTEAGNAVLLGAASFWEGVDVPGRALGCVIIDKLPFASPDEPVLRARMDALARQGGNPFVELSLPGAVLSLKQGVGRLIRDVDDSGVLMICDPRLKTKPYGKVFLNSLPPVPVTRRLEEVEDFIARTAAQE